MGRPLAQPTNADAQTSKIAIAALILIGALFDIAGLSMVEFPSRRVKATGETAMAKDSFIKKIANVFSGAAHDTPPDDQPVIRPEAAQQAAGEREATDTAPIPLEAPIPEPTARQTAVSPELTDALRGLTLSISRLNEGSRAQANLAGALRDSMAGLEEKREESTAAMREIAETLSRQTDILVDLQAKAGADAANNAQVADELRKLSDAIVSTNLGNARNVEVLDKIRQTFDGANTQLSNEGRQISKLMIVVIALQAAFLLAALVKWIILR
jgi:hypothetical protein